MNAKTVAVIITFAAFTIALNAIKIPAVFYPGNFFQLNQIPIVVAFLLFGFKIGTLIGVLNLMGSLTLFPLGLGGFIVYPMDFVSVLLMFAGIWLARMLIERSGGSERNSVLKRPVLGLTAGAIALRAGIMPVIDYSVINRILAPLILGIHRPDAVILGLVPFFILYNVIVALYVVPIACFLAKRISRYLGKDLAFSECPRNPIASFGVELLRRIY